MGRCQTLANSCLKQSCPSLSRLFVGAEYRVFVRPSDRDSEHILALVAADTTNLIHERTPSDRTTWRR
jgi:hypothetical protein